MEQREHGGVRPGAGRKPRTAPRVKRTVSLTAEADALVSAQQQRGESYSATLERLLLASAARGVTAQTPLEHLLAQVTTSRQPVRVIYRGLGWSRQALERLVASERVALAGLGVQVHVATKDAASGRREHYITVNGVRYSALSRDG